MICNFTVEAGLVQLISHTVCVLVAQFSNSLKSFLMSLSDA